MIKMEVFMKTKIVSRLLLVMLVTAVLVPGCGNQNIEEAVGAEETQDSVAIVQEESAEDANAADVSAQDDSDLAEADNISETVDDTLEAELAILQKGTLLFEGNTDEGYYPGTDIDWLLNASDEDGIGIIYACDDTSHGGWGVLGIGCNIEGGRSQIDIAAYADRPEKERLVYMTLRELANSLGADSVNDLQSFDLGAWNGGRIAGLYYLEGENATEMEELLVRLEEENAIVHTYDGHLSNPNAIDASIELYDYLKSIWGEKCLTGQMESTWMGSPDYEMNYILETTGRLPAIRGLDFMHNDFAGVTERAEQWWEKGGIVTICWHTGADFASGYNESKDDNINWDEAFTEGSDTYNSLIAGMDRAVPYLQELEDAGVPVLWRPFHELDGGWFWWSKGGSENFVKLWRMMYDHYTYDCGLDNLIWVYGYSGNGVEMSAWYPGDEYVDLVGADSYTPGANGDLYNKVVEIAADGMPIVFHECGNIPTEDQLKAAGTNWLYFMTWHTDYITDENNNDKDTLNEIYNSDYFITLDELSVH